MARNINADAIHNSGTVTDAKRVSGNECHKSLLARNLRLQDKHLYTFRQCRRSRNMLCGCAGSRVIVILRGRFGAAIS